MFEIKPEKDSEKVYKVIPTPMRDGVNLSSSIFFPKGEGPFPVILERTSYVISMGSERAKMIVKEAEFWNKHGYVFMIQDVRGRGDSDGEFIKYDNDIADGYDTIQWIAEQEWCSGSIGLSGHSYSANCGLLLLKEGLPNGLKAIWSSGIPGIWGKDPYGTICNGVLEVSRVKWSYWCSGRQMQAGSSSLVEGPVKANYVNWTEIFERLPVNNIHNLVGTYVEDVENYFHMDKVIEHLEKMKLDNIYDKINIPIVHMTGWMDSYSPTIYNFNKFKENFPDSNYLIIGPWEHSKLRAPQNMVVDGVDYGEENYIDIMMLKKEFFDYYLKNAGDFANRQPKIFIFDRYMKRWRSDIDVSNWFSQEKTDEYFYLASEETKGGKLTLNKPKELEVSYFYNPSNPIYLENDKDFFERLETDLTWMDKRDDVISFTTEPFEQDYEAHGLPFLELYVSSSAKDTDFIAMLSEVTPDGTAKALHSNGIVRMMYRNGLYNKELLEEDKVYKINLPLQPIYHVFKKGSRVRVQIQSSRLKMYFRNLNTGGDYYSSTESITAHNKIYLGGNHPSKLYIRMKRIGELLC